MATYLAERGLPAPDLEAAQNLDDVLEVCGAVYGTKGLASLKELPDRSVDPVWSRAVLEHIRRAKFAETMRELRRILKPGGVCSHGIDLQDHLAGALNNLRFPERIWDRNSSRPRASTPTAFNIPKFSKCSAKPDSPSR